tara:strand:+ start:4455 stop:5384 length:930 start_codon:yes stop_codon:yes gene_type:complete
MKNILYGLGFCALTLSCTTQQQVVQVAPQIQEVKKSNERVLKRKVAISRFSNETQYAKGIFYDKENDPIGKQALDILSAKLAASEKFILLEREGLEQIENELKMTGKEALKRVGADYLIIGSVTQFGRKNVGDVNAFSRTKSQTVEAGVSLRLVDVSTGQVIYSEEALGEAQTTNKTVMGYGERTGYDASLSDKAISAAISKLTENVINNCMEKPWRSFFLTYDADGILISGGKSQGLQIGDQFEVVQKGKEVENPQTGMMMELPGKVVGKVKVDFIGGETSQSEYSMVSFVNGDIEKENLSAYYIREI